MVVSKNYQYPPSGKKNALLVYAVRLKCMIQIMKGNIYNYPWKLSINCQFENSDT